MVGGDRVDLLSELIIQGGNFAQVHGIRPNTLLIGVNTYERMKAESGGLLAMEDHSKINTFMGMKILIVDGDPDYMNLAFRDLSLERSRKL